MNGSVRVRGLPAGNYAATALTFFPSPFPLSPLLSSFLSIPESRVGYAGISAIGRSSRRGHGGVLFSPIRSFLSHLGSRRFETVPVVK